MARCPLGNFVELRFRRLLCRTQNLTILCVSPPASHAFGIFALALRIGPAVPGIAPHDLRRSCAKMCRAAGGELEQIQLLLGHSSVQTTERCLGTKQDLVHAPNDGIQLRIEPHR